jgi:RNA polymerase sigma-70 factor, ECF subfamily
MSGIGVVPLDDVALMRAVVGGSQEALAALYDRHASAIFAVASRLSSDRQLAEEVVQETFLALWNRAETFDPRAGSLPAWLHTIARNRTVDRLRALARRPRVVPASATRAGEEAESAAMERLVASGEVVGGAEPGRGPEAQLEAAELRTTLRDALALMPDQERTVILLAYREDLSQSEIATRLGWPLGTVKTRTRRALLRLRQALADQLGAELSPEPVPVEVGD